MAPGNNYSNQLQHPSFPMHRQSHCNAFFCQHLRWQTEQTSDSAMMSIYFLSTNITKTSQPHFIFIVKKYAACLNIPEEEKEVWKNLEANLHYSILFPAIAIIACHCYWLVRYLFNTSGLAFSYHVPFGKVSFHIIQISYHELRN